MYSIWGHSRVVLSGIHHRAHSSVAGLTRNCVSESCLRLSGLTRRKPSSSLIHRCFCSTWDSDEVANDALEQDFREQSHFMKLALDQAWLAHGKGEVPVGAVLVGPDGQVLSKGHNTTEQDGDPTSHAEMHCIRHASSLSGGWRLLDCTLYVTLEPCPMCAGAILQSRVGTLVYGARNTLLGADGSWVHMLRCEHSHCQNDSHGDEITHDIKVTNMPHTPHPFHPNIKVIRGVMADECSDIMKDFFRQRRCQSE